MQSFIFGGNTGQSYEQMKRQRQLASSYAEGIGSPQTYGEGLTALGKGLASGLLNRAANKTEAKGKEAGKAKGQAAIDQFGYGAPSVLGGLLQQQRGGGTPFVEATQPAPQQGIAGAFQGAAEASGQFPMSLVRTESGGDWNALNSEGYGGRLQFGDARLADAARAGVIPAGVTGAAFSRMSPEQQQAVENWHFGDIDQQAQSRGLNQYIGQNIGGQQITQDSIRAMAHLGGIGGAAKFLQSGGASNPADSNGTSLADYARIHAGGGQPQQQPPMRDPMQGVDMGVVMQAMSDPFVDEGTRSMLGMLLQQRMGQQNATFEQQMQANDPYRQEQLAQLRLQNDELRNPQAKPADPFTLGAGQVRYDGNGNLVASGPEKAPDQTSDMQNYDFYASQEQAAGRSAMSFNEWKLQNAKAGATKVTTHLGGENLTPGQKKIDESFADTYLDWNGGGYADSAKQIGQLKDALSVIDKNGDDITGAVNLLPPQMQAFINPQGVIAKETVEEVVQRSLREVLGAQFTAGEGDRLIARAYNPLLPPAENRKRVQRLLGQIEQMGSAKQAMVDYFDENGTLRGYKGAKPKVSDLSDMMAPEKSPSAAAAPAPQPAPSSQGAVVASQAAYDALPSGSRFTAPDGSTRIKP